MHCSRLIVPRTSELPEQPAESLDLVLDAAAAQRVPDDRLMRRHAIDAEFALQHVERAGRRPMRRREQDRVGVADAASSARGPCRCAACCGMRPIWLNGRAPAGRAQHLAAEMLGVARRCGRSRSSRRAGTPRPSCSPAPWRPRPAPTSLVDTLTFSSASRSRIICCGIGGAARQIDRHAAEHDDIAARRRHLARGAHADVVGLVDLVLAAHHDGERGDHQRHAVRHDLVEFIREDFGGERRRGVADAGAAAVDVGAAACSVIPVSVRLLGRRRLSAAARLVHVRNGA